MGGVCHFATTACPPRCRGASSARFRRIGQRIARDGCSMSTAARRVAHLPAAWIAADRTPYAGGPLRSPSPAVAAVADADQQGLRAGGRRSRWATSACVTSRRVAARPQRHRKHLRVVGLELLQQQRRAGRLPREDRRAGGGGAKMSGHVRSASGVAEPCGLLPLALRHEPLGGQQASVGRRRAERGGIAGDGSFQGLGGFGGSDLPERRQCLGSDLRAESSTSLARALPPSRRGGRQSS